MANTNFIAECRAEWARIDAARLVVRRAFEEYRPLKEIIPLMAMSEAEDLLAYDRIRELERSLWN